MERQFRIKKIVVAVFALVCLTGKAQTMPDSVIMVVGDKHVPLSEFLYIARKNNEVDFSNKKSADKYVEMFKNFKLKVLEAEHQGLSATPTFEQELEMYKAQLIAGYLSDRKGEEAAARAIYERESECLTLTQILIPFTKEQCVTKDTIRHYEKALEIYNRVCAGEDFDTLGIRLLEDTQSKQKRLMPGVEADDSVITVRYEYIPRFLPMQKLKVFENKAYSTPVGKVSFPVRTSNGYSIIKVHARQPNFRYIQLAYINIPYIVDSVTRSKEMVENLAKEAYAKASSGEDFAALVKTYSVDTAGNGVLPKYTPGQLQPFIEDAVRALSNPGDITPPLLSEEGAYIFKLIERKDRPSFDEVKDEIISDMGKTELNFDLYRAFDDYLKKEYDYTFYPDAYAELEELCDEYFPSNDNFWAKAKDMDKTLILINGEAFPQKEFAYYMQSKPFSAKTYSKDFMKEMFDLFVRDMATTYERNNLEIKYPEIPHLIQEYRDGILLFELSNEKIWTKPVEEQVTLEEKWIKELNEKYPVTINSKLLKKLIGKKQR
ncbi:MAG: peptidylprolyl isomerase [Tannerellaceae bacterium]|jgi:peptidyl-prolyl cis-trans isomerase SurA|nr:peptidylprolyl isomerase [Tannerellaceae bacterium]